MKIKYKIFYFILLLKTSLIFAQAPEIQWQKTLGGTNNDNSFKIQQTSDNGYIIIGFSNSNDIDISGNQGYNDCWIIKLTSDGTVEWKKLFGGNLNDYAYSIQQTSDGGYIFAGFTSSSNGDVTFNHGGYDYWIVKLNSTGVIVWQKTYGGSENDYASHIQQTLDGGYIIAGHTNSNNGDITEHYGDYDYWIVKINNIGSIEWQKTYGGSLNDIPQFIQQTSDGGYILAGSSASIDGHITNSNGSADYWVIKLSSLGVLEWQNSYGGSNGDFSYCIKQTNDDGYIVAGYIQSINIEGIVNYGDIDSWVIKLDTNGTIEWNKNYGGTSVDFIHEIEQTSDDGYIFLGFTDSSDNDVIENHGENDYWIVKINATGTIQWQKTFGGSSEDYGRGFQQTNDGGYIIVGATTSNDGDLIINNGLADCTIIKLGPDNLGLFNFSKTTTISLYPNPAQDKLTVKLNYFEPSLEMNITDILGKTIHYQKVDGLSTSIKTSSLKSGVYIVNIINGNQIISQRFIKN